ncbi:helix-turn-helix domain-containing protein [Nocardia sp. NPDC052566]|uniref:helix-turn-helix domain-containing protein n=1 Tax=Nocardia sp. NPDC052566 TaxID=3364330 RepID=UPI0037C7C6D7
MFNYVHGLGGRARMSPRELMLPLPSLADYISFHRGRLGLTRPALAKRAYVSIGTITKLERGEQTGLNPSTLNSLAEALELTTADERRHLDELTRVHIPRPWFPQELRSEVTEHERAMLDALMPQPAAYCNERWDVVAANEAYEALFPGRLEAVNAMRWLFSPAGRAAIVDWETEAAADVARMRGILAHFGNPAVGVALLSQLQSDPDFARLWLERRVRFDRAVDEPEHVHTASGPVSVTMQLQSLPAQVDWLHLVIAVVHPYSGPPTFDAPVDDRS